MVISGGGSAGLVLTYGSYNGDNTDNHAIAHSLGKVPRLIVVTSNTDNKTFVLMGGIPYIWFTSGAVFRTQTAPTDTYFYVGKVASYPETANANGLTYYYVCIG